MRSGRIWGALDMSCEEWRTSTLGNITKWLSGGTPSKANSSYWNGKIPWISANVMKLNRLYDSELHISKSGLVNGSKIAPKGSLLLLVRGSELHKRIPICKPLIPMAFNQDVKAIIPDYKIDTDFLLYWFMAYEQLLLRKVESTSIGAGKLDTKMMQDLTILYPEMNEQRAIARILSSLDDKIELNNRMNKTLEEIAQTLFKRWFIDFEFPDENGNPYKSSGGKMVESEMGMIPEGWEICKLNEIASLKNGVNYNRKQSGQSFKILNVRNFTGDYILDESNLEEILYESKRVNEYFLYDFDTVIVRSAKPGETVLIKSLEKPILYSGFCIRIRAQDINMALYSFFYVKKSIEILENSANGTIFKNLNQKILGGLKIVIPNQNIIEQLNINIFPIIDMLVKNKREITTLSQLRDTLLPKLMSGDIRVSIEEGVI